ncbi:MAG: DUF2141 domain-containing protein [Thermus sp.]|nr:DUF2141 domain-containing protein [Thermus sp.]
MDRSKAVQVLRDGRSAPYTLRDLARGTYLVAAWKDVNGNDDLDEADYLGVYVDRQGNYLVRPPRGGVDISLELMASLESLREHGPSILQVIQKGLRETRRP